MKKKLLYFHNNPEESNCFGLIIVLLGMGLMIISWSPMILINSGIMMLVGVLFLMYGTSRFWYIEHVKERERVYKRMQEADKQLGIDLR